MKKLDKIIFFNHDKNTLKICVTLAYPSKF